MIRNRIISADCLGTGLSWSVRIPSQSWASMSNLTSDCRSIAQFFLCDAGAYDMNAYDTNAYGTNALLLKSLQERDYCTLP